MTSSEVRPGVAFERTAPVIPDIPHPYWTRTRVADALGAGPGGDIPFGGISTDTRTLQKGDLFVALKGDNFDAHKFLCEARDAGASGLVVSDASSAVGLGLPVYAVGDTLDALGLLANKWRRVWGRSVIAVAGSNGKTSTKDLLTAALGESFEVHATRGNMNNRVGVPLTLLAVRGSAEIAIVEIGTSSPGEVGILRDIVQPDMAVLTSIGEEHLEGLTDMAGVVREECEVFRGVTLAVLPARYPEAVAVARLHARAVRTTALSEESTTADIVPDSWVLDGEGRAELHFRGESVVLPLSGVHQAENAMLAIATAEACGASVAAAVKGLAAASVAPMRGSWERAGNLLVINDAYNANPPSMIAALDLFDAVEPEGGERGGTRQKVAVLGTMREMGESSAGVHGQVAHRALASKADLIVAVGDFVDAFRKLAPGDPRILYAAGPDEAWQELEPRLAVDAVVLLKASRGVRLERMLPSLLSWAVS